MSGCVRAGCHGQVLATWWQLCTACTFPLLDRVGAVTTAAADQRATAGWQALDWAERIAPSRWGNAVEADEWVTTIRCLVFASVATGRSSGCPHTASEASTPVVVVPRAVGVLHCPSCAEPVVAQHTVTGASCDRCRQVTVGPSDRVALATGASLIIVGNLCDACSGAVFQLGMPTSH